MKTDEIQEKILQVKSAGERIKTSFGSLYCLSGGARGRGDFLRTSRFIFHALIMRALIVALRYPLHKITRALRFAHKRDCSRVRNGVPEVREE